MTLDEAIKKEEIITEENQRVVDTGIVFDDVTIDMLYCDDTEVIAEHLANYQRCADRHRLLAEWLKELKQLKKQTRWIPVSEELPERYKEVIVTDIETSDTYQSRYIGNGYWECDNGLYKNRIIAWQPKPKPYEPQESEEE